jgi:hypothetical protein
MEFSKGRSVESQKTIVRFKLRLSLNGLSLGKMNNPAASGRRIKPDLFVGRAPHCNFKISPQGDGECTPSRFNLALNTDTLLAAGREGKFYAVTCSSSPQIQVQSDYKAV